MKIDKYDEVLKIGNSTVYIVSPESVSEEEREKILNEYHQAGYEIWKSLPQEVREKLSKKTKDDEKFIKR